MQIEEIDFEALEDCNEACEELTACVCCGTRSKSR